MSGVVNAQMGQQLFLDYVADPEFDPRAVMITDGRGITKINAQFSEILNLTTGMAKHLKKFDKGAESIVIVSDDVQFGFARVLASILSTCSKINMKVVRERELTLHLRDMLQLAQTEVAPQTA